MRRIGFGAVGTIVLVGGIVLVARGSEAGKPLVLHTRLREAVPASGGNPSFAVKEKTVEWDPSKTAIIICDMWDQHWCQGATRRVGELAPAMNRAVAAARAKGVLIIHAPSSCMDAVQGPPRPQAGPGGPEGREPARRHRRVVQQDPGRGEGGLSRSTSPTAAATTARSARRARPGSRRSPPSRSATRTPSATRASRSGTCWRAAASTTSCSWAFTRTCASSAGRSACGSWSATARTSSWSAT